VAWQEIVSVTKARDAENKDVSINVTCLLPRRNKGMLAHLLRPPVELQHYSFTKPVEGISHAALFAHLSSLLRIPQTSAVGQEEVVMPGTRRYTEGYKGAQDGEVEGWSSGNAQVGTACCFGLCRAHKSCAKEVARESRAAAGGGYSAAFCLEDAHKIVCRPRKMLVFVNPISGRRRGVEVWESVQGWFEAANISTRVTVTSRRGEANEVLRDTDVSQYDGIVAVGGDGTFNECLSALLTHPLRPAQAESIARGSAGERGREHTHQWPPLGIIPAGTDCAMAKFIAHTSAKLAVQAIINRHELRELDVLCVRQRQLAGAGAYAQDHVHFSACGTAWGIPGEVANASETLRGTWGVHRYTAALLNSLIRLKPVNGAVRIVPAVNQEKAATTACKAQCAVCAESAVNESNGAEVRVEGGFLFVCCLKCERTFTPFVHASDGCMDVLIIRERGLGSLASLYSLVESGGRHLKNQNFHYHKAREVTIMPRDVHQGFLNIDGEVAAAVETKISVMPKAITVFFALPVQ